MLKTVRAKFRCSLVDEAYPGTNNVELDAEYSESPEDNQFSEATPSGRMEMLVSNPAVEGFFKPGKSYYLDITEVEETL